MSKKIAVYAGSFNPFTLGHLSIVKEASEIFDTVFIVISYNSEKKNQFDSLKMKDCISNCLNRLSLKNCFVCVYDKMIADFCLNNDAKYLIRGLRNTTDYMYEENIAKINYELNPDLKTVYFRAENEVISSSVVREFLKYNKDISKYVPIEVLDYILKV